MREIKKFGIDVSHWQGDFDFVRAKSKEGCYLKSRWW